MVAKRSAEGCLFLEMFSHLGTGTAKALTTSFRVTFLPNRCKEKAEK